MKSHSARFSLVNQALSDGFEGDFSTNLFRRRTSLLHTHDNSLFRQRKTIVCAELCSLFRGQPAFSASEGSSNQRCCFVAVHVFKTPGSSFRSFAPFPVAGSASQSNRRCFRE